MSQKCSFVFPSVGSTDRKKEMKRILSGFLLINETVHISVYKLSLSYVYMIALSARNEINSHILHLIFTIICYCYFIKI